MRRTHGQPGGAQGRTGAGREDFLAVRGLAGDRAEYRLSLGQVYYWLGKQEQGRKLFDEALKADGRRIETLMTVANLLRELGAMDDSRSLLEEAFNQPGADLSKRQQAAMLRTMSRKDNDDAIAWLERAMRRIPEVKAYLAESRGHKATAAGQDEEAAAFYRQCRRYLCRRAGGPATLNNGASAYLALYQVNGDKAALEKAVRMQEKADQPEARGRHPGRQCGTGPVVGRPGRSRRRPH